MSGVPTLMDALKDVDECVPAAVARSLGQIGAAAKEAVPARIDAFKDEVKGVRARAAEALKKIDPEAAREVGVP
jgi:HEAT repeat protein